MSVCVDIAKAVRNALATTRYDWPANIVPTTPDRLDSTVDCRTYVAPLVDREKAHDLTLITSPIGTTEGDVRDTCGRTWQYEIDVTVYQLLQTNTIDYQQPASLDELDKLIGLAESVRNFLDEYRTLDNKYSLRQMELTVMSEEIVTSHQFFSSSIRAFYFSQQ